MHPRPILKGNVITNLKRIIGRKYSDKFVSKVKASCKATVKDNKGMAAFYIPNVNRNVMPEEAASKLLDDMYNAVMSKIDNKKVAGVIVTVPATYNNEQRCATKRAIMMSKFGNLKNFKLTDEPSAAAISYGIGENYRNDNIVVYDLGGGTFDVSIIKVISETEFEVLATDGDIGIGGETFDDYILGDLRSTLRSIGAIDPLQPAEDNEEGLEMEKFKEKSERIFALLREACREAKEGLSANNCMQWDIDLCDFYEKVDSEFPREESGNELDDYAGIMFDESVGEYVLTRAKLEALIKKDIERTIDITKRCIDKAGLRKKEDISAVVMVGGSSMIPYVQSCVEKEFGHGRVKYANPSECVAIGASMLASMKVHNKTTRDLCITAAGNKYNVMIPRNTEYPTEGKKVFKTGRFNVGMINCSAYEHDTDYHLMSEVKVEDEDMEGMEVDVEFKYNVTDEGICNLTVRNLDTGRVLLKDKPLILNRGVY